MKKLKKEIPRLDKEFYSAVELGLVIGMHPETIKNYRYRGLLKGYKFGHRTVRFHRDDIMEFFEQYLTEVVRGPSN